MKKEIIVNADDLESRVAILEQGQLAELHVEREARIVGSVYKARVVSVLPGMDAAFAEVGLDRNVFLCADDVGFVSRDGVTVTRAPRSASISQRLKEKQEVVVQIVRAPVAGKGARASTRLAFPGRYLVLLAAHGTQVGISRKIEDRKERDRLRKIGESIRPKDCGVIIRTEAEDHNREDIEADLKVLLDLRDRMMKKAARAKAPAMLHQDLTLVYQVIRDVFTEDVEQLVIDEKSVYDNAVELVTLIAPKLRKRIKLYRGRMPIFHKYGIEGEIDRLLRRKVWLAAGGYISIDQAEAFTAIDVNTGRYTGSTGLEDTIFRTNMEAAEEVARQLRLRDLGGIIVIDFIDMERAQNRERVMRGFEEALKRDRQRTKILHLSPLGLIEMTRKRRGESLMGILTETCPHCAGLGRVRRALTVALKIEREVGRLASEQHVAALMLRAGPQVASILVGEDGNRAVSLEKRVGCPVYIRADYNMGIEEHELSPVARADAEKTMKKHSRGQEMTLDRLDPPEPGGDGDSYGWAEGYRVLVESDHAKAGVVVVVDEAARSFGRVHVKGAKRKDEPARRGRGRRGRPELEVPPEVCEIEPVIEDELERGVAPEGFGDEASEATATIEPARRPSRRRRGGRRRRGPRAAAITAESGAPESPAEPVVEPLEQPVERPAAEPAEQPARAPRPRRRRRPRAVALRPATQAAPTEVSAPKAAPQGEPAAAPKRKPRPHRRRRPRGAPKPPTTEQAPPPAAPAPPAPEVAPKRRVGLLRRGARTIARVVREDEE